MGSLSQPYRGPTDEDWERWKNAIHTLYILEDRKLGGPDGVKETMENRHNFKASESQYHRRLDRWGFNKKLTAQNWRIVDSKFHKRKADGKESEMFYQGLLVPAAKVRREISRHGYTTLERFQAAQVDCFAESPRTPPGVEICTPSRSPVYRRVFRDLPVLGFLRSTLKPDHPLPPLDESSVSRIFPSAMSTTLTGRDDIPEPVRALLPIAAFGQELESASSPPSSGTLTPFHHDATTLLLLGIGYAVMNNFPGNCNRKEIIQLLEKHLWQPLSKMTFHFLQEPTNRALLSGIFPLVVESGNVQFAETLLKTLRPNQIQDERPSLLDANTCMHKRLPIRLTPLQHACLSGRVDLADVLLRYGARIDDLEHAWPCSPLFLAMYGYKNYVWQVREMRLLIRLITRLLDAGANPNPSTRYVDGIHEWTKGSRLRIDSLSSVLKHEYSPLALAATYRLHELVNLLINCGADVNYRVENKFSVLQEYLLPFCGRRKDNYWREKDRFYFWNGDISDRTCAVNLISQGTGLGDHEPCDPGSVCEWNNFECCSICVQHKSACELDRFECHSVCKHYQLTASSICETHCLFECYSALDLAILTGDQNFVEYMIKAGGQPTRHSLELAFRHLTKSLEVFFSILKLNPPVPDWAVFGKPSKLISDSSDLGLAWERTKFQKYLLTMVASVKIGADLFFQHHLEEDDPEITIADKCNAIKTTIWKCFCDGDDNFDGVPDRIRHIVHSWIMKNQVPEPARSWVLGLLLIFALMVDDLIEAYTLLDSGADVNASLAYNWRDSLGFYPSEYSEDITQITPLQLAILRGESDLVTKLLDDGANINHPEHGNLLVSAIALGVESHVIQALLPHACLCLPGRVDLDLWSRVSNRLLGLDNWYDLDPDISGYLMDHVKLHCSPLTVAILTKRWDVAEDFLCFMASQWGGGLPDSRIIAEAGTTQTSLWAAVWQKNPRLVRLLLDYGADPNDADVLDCAATQESSDCLDQLLEGLTARERRGKMNNLHIALVSAIKEQRWDNFSKILKTRIVDLDLMVGSETPLGHIIGHKGLQLHQRATLAASLLEAGANINAICKDCLDYYPPHTVILEAIETRNIQLMNLLLSDPRIDLAHTPDQVPYTPLQLAADTNCPEIVQLLLAHGHNPNLFRDPEHFRYCWESDKYYRCGTSVQVATTAGNAEILEMLLQHNANPNPTTRLVPHTALQIACRDGHMKLVELLIEYGANVNAPPAHTNGATALQFAAIGGYLGIAQFLLDKGADVNAPGAREGGRTALEGAAEHGRLDMVQLLKNAGVDLLSKQWETAVELATKNGHYAVRELLYSFFQQDLDTDV